MKCDIASIELRRRIVGKIILAIALIAFGVIVAIWWNSTVNKNERVSLYFENSVHGLSSGADVRSNGRKIGHVISIKIRNVPAENGEMRHYALVSAIIDTRKFYKYIGTLDEKNGTEKIEQYVEEGLKARLLLPSILSPTLSVELFTDRKNPALLINDPQNTDTEIPTVEKTTSKQIDAINELLGVKGIIEVSEKICRWEENLKKFDNAINLIDFRELNSTSIKKIEMLKIAISPEEFHEILFKLNKSISELNSAIENNSGDTEECLKETIVQLEKLKNKINAINTSIKEVNSIFHRVDATPVFENAEKLQKLINEFSKFSNEVLF